MRYVLRADASLSIGAGHVMRSSAIAEELINRGKNVVFIGQISDFPWVEKRIASLGFTFVSGDSKQFESKADSDVLILDSYKIDIDETFISPEKWLHIVAIVDELTPNYDCTLRIHPGLDSDWTGNSKVPILAGPKYIPFRSSLSSNMRIIGDEQNIPKIAVVAGGSDPYRLVHEVAKTLARIPEQFEAFLFTKSDFDSDLDSRFHFFQVGKQMDVLTREVDLVLTTASTSSLEFLARGFCVGVICAVDNQSQYYETLGRLGVVAQLGLRTSDKDWQLDEQKIYSLVTSSTIRSNLIAKATGLIDFNGASRIVDAITTL
jgi:spore coat polysaccharide biosynthesis predicted glycosyltransferase SpsG